MKKFYILSIPTIIAGVLYSALTDNFAVSWSLLGVGALITVIYKSIK